MKRNWTFAALIFSGFLINYVFPILGLKLVKGENGLAVIFVLFLILNPFLSVVTGIFAAFYPVIGYFLPGIQTLLYLVLSRMVFGTGDSGFTFYAFIYLMLGIAAMAITTVILKLRKKYSQSQEEAGL